MCNSNKNDAAFLNRQAATLAKIYLKICPVCGIEFKMAKNQKYCTKECKGKVQYLSGRLSTENQYELISGNWRRYLHRLLYSDGRKRDGLTVDILLTKLKEQDYKCALTGELLTCNLTKGENIRTNVSVDRISAGGPYTQTNIQLVCKAVNGLRRDMDIPEFRGWCAKVVSYALKDI